MKDDRDIQQLQKVGAATAQALRAAGFTSLVKVATAEPDELADVLSSLRLPAPPRPEDLIAQARVLTGYETSAKAARKRVTLARLLVKEIGEGLLKAPAFRPALLKRIVGCPTARARIIRYVVEDLG